MPKKQEYLVPATESLDPDICWTVDGCVVTETTDEDSHPSVRGFSVEPAPYRRVVRPVAGSRPEDGFFSIPAYGSKGKPKPRDIVGRHTYGKDMMTIVRADGSQEPDARFLDIPPKEDYQGMIDGPDGLEVVVRGGRRIPIDQWRRAYPAKRPRREVPQVETPKKPKDWISKVRAAAKELLDAILG